MATKEVIDHKGKVIFIDECTIDVEIVNKSMCAGCHAKSVCAMGDSKDKVITVPYYNDGEYAIGEEVNVMMEKSMGIKAVWLSYVIPVFILLVFLLTLQGFNLSELWIGLISVGSVALYYLVIYLFRDKIAGGFIFKIDKLTN